MLTITQRAVGSSKILLLDLVHTFATRPGGKTGKNYETVIWETETYRRSLLRKIQEDAFFVVLLTARSTRYRTVTLENIHRHTGGWQPDVAVFNEDNSAPPAWKLAALHRYVFPSFGTDRSRYFALESNRQTTQLVYQHQGIAVTTFEKFLSGKFEPSLDW